MALAAGGRLGPYEILAPLGAGGMGEVYRARDTRLGREVAIKVLPGQVAGDPDALARFEREARAVASLSHPNILAIHDFGVEGGTAYSASELLDGETLRVRLGGSPLPARKAVEYGVQMARGLAAAHDKGIIHRDLKPENVFITRDGQAKILDFGLARHDPPRQTTSTASPTMDVVTHPGAVMGTMGYMSPEQLRGQSTDARADIFSFGAVLYEMLSGRRAFWRDTEADTITALIREDPAPLTTVQPGLSPALQRIVDHCLEKSPAERFQSARDLAFHLEAAVSASSSAGIDAAAVEPAPSRRGLRRAGVFTAGLALGATLGAALVALILPALRPAEAETAPRLRYLSYSGREGDPSVSPDGRLIAYTSYHGARSQIWLRQHPGGEEVALTAGPGDLWPRISPDGSQVLFTRAEGARRSLYRVPILGGEPRKVLDDASEGDWSPDGRRIAFLRTSRDAPELTSIVGIADASGEGSREIARVERTVLAYPRWSPDGTKIAAVNAGAENAPNVLLLIPAGGGEVRTVVPPSPPGRLSSPIWLADGSGMLYAQATGFAVTASDQQGARLIRHDLASGRTAIKLWLPMAANVMDALDERTVVLAASSPSLNLREVRLAGGAVVSAALGMTRGSSLDRQPTFSPDGRWVLFSSNRGGNLDLWRLEVATGAIRRVTEDAADDWDPAYTPDGRHIIWSASRSGHFEIWICNTDGTGARQLTQDGVDAENPTATPDGRWVVYNSANPAHPGIWKIHPDGTGAVRIVEGSFSTPDVSPDGQYVAFRGAVNQRRFFVARLEDGTFVIPPFDVPGSLTNGRPRWSPDGRHFLYTATDDSGAAGIYIQDFVPGRDTRAGRRALLEFVHEQNPESFGLSPDGTRLIYAAAVRVDSLMLAEDLQGVTLARRRAP